MRKLCGVTQFVLLSLVLLAGLPAVAQTPAVTHNTWTTGANLPTARLGAAAGAIGPNIYVIDGSNSSAMLGVNEIYNTKKNTWTTGASDPNPRGLVAYAVVNRIFYIFGGSDGSSSLDLTESFNPATRTWTTLAAMPYAQMAASAVVDKDVIYLIGGINSAGRALNNVASYNTTTNAWTEESPALSPHYYTAAGLLGTTVVAADAFNGFVYIGDNEGYSPKANAWSELAPDPTARVPACWAAIKGQLYVAGGTTADGRLLTLTESYSTRTKSWTTLAPMPVGIWFAAASATTGGKLYCFGGGVYQHSVNNNVQIYQP